MSKIAICISILLAFLVLFGGNVEASLTKEQSEDVAYFATTFIEKGNQRRDERGYPLLVYALNGSTASSIELRRSGYNGELYYLKNNNYHRRNGYYLDLGYKWTMDCGDYVAYIYHTTLGLDLMLSNNDPWHCIDMYNDANKYDNSKYFEFIYKNVPISKLDDSKLQKGDIVLKIGPGDNHAMLYVDEGFRTAHASRNAIRYGANPTILGFEVMTLNRFYKSSTIVSIVRLKDGIIPEDFVVNTTITWPDTGEVETFIVREEPEVVESGEIEVVSETSPVETIEVIEVVPDLVEVNGTELVKEDIYIEKEMRTWITEELRRLYLELQEKYL